MYFGKFGELGKIGRVAKMHFGKRQLTLSLLWVALEINIGHLNTDHGRVT